MTAPLIIRRCEGNRKAWALDTGTSLTPKTAMSVDSLVNHILQNYGPRVVTLVIYKEVR